MSSAEAQRSSLALKTRTTPSLHPLTMSPLGMDETVHTEIAGWTMVSFYYRARLEPYDPPRQRRCRHSKEQLKRKQKTCDLRACI